MIQGNQSDRVSFSPGKGKILINLKSTPRLNPFAHEATETAHSERGLLMRKPPAFADRWWSTNDGLRLYARDYPASPGRVRLPVICLHGLTRNSADFEEVAPYIAALDRRVTEAHEHRLARRAVQEHYLAGTARRMFHCGVDALTEDELRKLMGAMEAQATRACAAAAKAQREHVAKAGQTFTRGPF